MRVYRACTCNKHVGLAEFPDKALKFIMAERFVAVEFTGLMETIKSLLVQLAVEVLIKRGLHADHHDLIVFSSKASRHGDLFIRKECLMNVLKECCSDDHQLKVVA